MCSKVQRTLDYWRKHRPISLNKSPEDKNIYTWCYLICTTEILDIYLDHEVLQRTARMMFPRQLWALCWWIMDVAVAEQLRAMLIWRLAAGTLKRSKEVGRISLLYYSAATFFELMSGSQTRDEFIASKGDPPATNLCLLHNLYPMYPNWLDDETTSCNPRD